MKRHIHARFLLALLVFGCLASAAVAVSDPVKGPVRAVVTRYNEAQFRWLHDPGNKELKEAFLKTVNPGSKAEKEALELTQKYIDRNAHLLDESTHSIVFIDVQVIGVPSTGMVLLPRPSSTAMPPTATVKTEEDSNWVSSSGRRFTQKKNPHTYKLEMTENGWKVNSEEFEFQQ